MQDRRQPAIDAPVTRHPVALHELLASTPPDPADGQNSIPARRSLIALFAVLLAAWVAIAGIGGPYFGKISEVVTNDRSTH